MTPASRNRQRRSRSTSGDGGVPGLGCFGKAPSPARGQTLADRQSDEGCLLSPPPRAPGWDMLGPITRCSQGGPVTRLTLGAIDESAIGPWQASIKAVVGKDVVVDDLRERAAAAGTWHDHGVEFGVLEVG